MNLLKTSYLSFIATFVRIVSGIVINKAIAIFIGPSGLAFIGQYQNFSQLAMRFGQGAINNGVTKYTAEYGQNDPRLAPMLSTALKISLVCSLVTSCALITFSSELAVYYLKSNEYRYVFVIFGFTLTLFVLNNLLLSIVNGFKEIKIFISINILQSILGLIFTTVLISLYHLDGALIAMVTNQSIVFFIVLFILRRNKVINTSYFRARFSSVAAKKLSKYSLMALTTAFTIPVSHLIIRNQIGSDLGWEQAGYWQAVWYISSMYLMVISLPLNTYYLPRLSEISTKLELRNEVINGYKIILPIVIAASLVIFFLREFIIEVLFSEDFIPTIELFKWQLIGDVIRVASMLLAYIMQAKAMTKIFIFSEILFALSFVALSQLLVTKYGLVGVTYAYAANYSIYFISILFIMRKKIF